VDALDLFSDRQDDLMATIFADARQLAFDGEGRIVLPDDMLAHANIRDSVAFVGRGPTFQIWEPETFRQHQEAARARARREGATLSMRLSGEGKP
jgi:MraZ protein